MEEWKDIEGYPNYMVSNLGRVKSLGNDKTRKEKILNGCKDKDGYFQIKLSKEGKVKMYKVHRLVAQAFLDNPNNLPEVNHKDEDKTDNIIWINDDGSVDYNKSNLEWCDRNYNNNYGSHNEMVSKALKNRKGLSKRFSKPILQFTKNNEFVRRWNSAKDVERELGIHHSIICMCCKGKQKTAYGYKWGYEKDYERIPFKVFDLNIYEKIA